jgi:hypothetical protein
MLLRNMAASGNGAVTSLLHGKRVWRTVPEQQRYAKAAIT